jgi:hypothetical protein
MPDLAHLTEKDGMPDFRPRRRILRPGVQIVGGGAVSTAQTFDEEEFSVFADAPAAVTPAQQRAVASAASDPFAHMDFRVSYEDNVISINRGRVYYTAWSPGLGAFQPAVAIIEAETLPLELEEGEEDGSVWLSLPFWENGNIAIFGADMTPVYPERTYTNVDGEIYTASTYWSGFDRGEYVIRKALAAGSPKFAVATADLAPVPVYPTDYMVQLAWVGFTSGLRHTHFGSVWTPGGFDAEWQYS